jgi:RimJ/RimL family protein N-acetyltransferase
VNTLTTDRIEFIVPRWALTRNWNLPQEKPRSDLTQCVNAPYQIVSSCPSLQRRFFVPKLHFSDKELDFLTNVDFKDHVAFVAELSENGRRVIVGGGRYIMVQPGQAEMAFTVIDAYQGKGIGSVLMRHLIAIARDGALQELIAEVLPENAPMLKLFSRFGFRTVASVDLQVKHLALQLA